MLSVESPDWVCLTLIISYKKNPSQMSSTPSLVTSHANTMNTERMTRIVTQAVSISVTRRERFKITHSWGCIAVKTMI